MPDQPKFRVGQEVNISFTASIITAAQRGELTVQTASVEFQLDPDAVDITITPTGVVHTWGRCPQCSRPIDECGHQTKEARP
jgi:hypothetical protein